MTPSQLVRVLLQCSLPASFHRQWTLSITYTIYFSAQSDVKLNKYVFFKKEKKNLDVVLSSLVPVSAQSLRLMFYIRCVNFGLACAEVSSRSP